MSGITTTGSTIISNLEMHQDQFFYGELCFNGLGGIGIIVMAITLNANNECWWNAII